MSYFGHIEIMVFHIVPHSFILKVYIDTPAVFTHRRPISLSKIPIGIFTMCSVYLIIIRIYIRNNKLFR